MVSESITSAPDEKWHTKKPPFNERALSGYGRFPPLPLSRHDFQKIYERSKCWYGKGLSQPLNRLFDAIREDKFLSFRLIIKRNPDVLFHPAPRTPLMLAAACHVISGFSG